MARKLYKRKRRSFKRTFRRRFTRKTGYKTFKRNINRFAEKKFVDYTISR